MNRFSPTGVLLFGAFSLAVGFLLTGCSGKIEPGEAEVKRKQSGPVSVTTVAEMTKKREYTAVGTVRARNSAIVSPQIMGRITAIRAREGDRVKEGSLLLTIDDSQARAGVRAAEGMLEEAMRSREELEATIEQAMSGLELAKKTHERYRGLIEQKIISQQEFDEVVTEYEIAKKQLEITRSRREQVDARVAQAEANLQNARVLLGYSRVVAPFDGIVARKFADLGTMASPGNPLFVIDEVDTYRLELSISESFANKIRKGSHCAVQIDAAGIENIEATVREVVPELDPATRSFTAKVDIPPTGGIRAGMFGRATFALGDEQVVAVPEEALVRIGGYQGVYVLTEGDVVRFIMVKTGSTFDGSVEVLSGLTRGQHIVTSGIDGIRDGDVVEVER